MKSYTWWLCLAVVVAGLALAGTAWVSGAEENENEQHEYGAPPAPMQMAAHHRPPVEIVLTPGMEGVFWHALNVAKCAARAGALVIAACHVLLAVWVFLDIRKRGEGHGIFIALALLAGFCGAILYALVRLADTKKA
jgi:hypothetical protein